MTGTRHFLDLTDISPGTLAEILAHGHRLKKLKFSPPQLFSGLSLAMIFEKKSTRTRLSFETAMKQLGGHTMVMSIEEIQLSGAESIRDTAKVLSRYVDAVMIRMGDHETLRELAAHSDIPVINGLTDMSHPCQIMADLMSVEERLGGLKGMKAVWLGDYNNVARTWTQAAEIFDMQLTVSCPPNLLPGTAPNAHVTLEPDPQAAVHGRDIVVTDTWVSMGQEGKDIAAFAPYQVNAALMARAAGHAIFMHCMPIHRGEEVTDEVADGPQSVIYDEAENRLHAQKAILAWCLEHAGVTPISK